MMSSYPSSLEGSCSGERREPMTVRGSNRGLFRVFPIYSIVFTLEEAGVNMNAECTSLVYPERVAQHHFNLNEHKGRQSQGPVPGLPG